VRDNWQNCSSVYFHLDIFWRGNWKTRHSALNDSLTSVCSSYRNVWISDLLGLFPNIWTVPLPQRLYYLFLCCDFALQAVLDMTIYTASSAVNLRLLRLQRFSLQRVRFHCQQEN
jgi:hypothetical protein